MVYISGYTYNSQHIDNGECDDKSEGVALWLKHDRLNEWLYLSGGQAHAPPLEMSAGETLKV